MLQWFLSFPDFTEFTEILFYLGKTQIAIIYQNVHWCALVQVMMDKTVYKT